MMSSSNSIVLSDEQFLVRTKLSKPFSIHDIRYKGHADEWFKGKRLEVRSELKTSLNFAKDLTWCILNMKCHIMSRSLVNTRKKNCTWLSLFTSAESGNTQFYIS